MRMDPHNMVKYKAHMPHRYMHHPTHVHIRHPLHTPTIPTPTPFPTHTSTIPSTHLHHPLHTLPLSHTHTSTIPYTHLHHPLHTPPLSPIHTSTIPYTHLHHPLHTPPPSLTHTSTICLPACRIYRSNNYFRCPTSGPGQRPKTFCSKNVLRQIRHTLCAKSDIRFAPNRTYALRQIRHAFCAKSDLVLRQIALMSNVLVRDLPGHRTNFT